MSNHNLNKSARSKFIKFFKSFNRIVSTKIVCSSKIDADWLRSNSSLLRGIEGDETPETDKQRNESDEIEQHHADLFKSLLAKSQIVPIRHYLTILNSLLAEHDSSAHHVSTLDLFSISGVSELITVDLPMNCFYNLFTKTSTNCFKFIKIIVQCLSAENLDSHQRGGKEETDLVAGRASRNFLNYNWLDQYLSEAVFFFDSYANNNDLIKPINLTLKFYDDKLTNLNELSEFLWSNFAKLSATKQNLSRIETNSLAYLHKFISSLKQAHFNSDNDLFMSYLAKKGFKAELLEIAEKLKSKFSSDTFLLNKIELIVYGCMLVYLYSPIDPLDPLEYARLVEKNQLEQTELREHEAHLNTRNKFRLKEYNAVATLEFERTVEKSFIERLNKASYFLIKNEFEMNVKQFAAPGQIRKFLSQFSAVSDRMRQNEEEEHKSWLISLENFIQKLTSTFYSYTDVINLPVNGLSLIGYSINALFTNWKARMDEKHNRDYQQSSAHSLLRVLVQYPHENGYSSIASQLNSFSSGLIPTNNDNDSKQLVDELNFLSLLHLLNESFSRFKLVERSADTERNDELLVRLLQYFAGRYKAYKEACEARDTIETYKYKAYGQKEIEDELVQAELEREFPNFSHAFEEFLDDVNLLDKNNETQQQTIQVKQIYFKKALKKEFKFACFKYLASSFQKIGVMLLSKIFYLLNEKG